MNSMNNNKESFLKFEDKSKYLYLNGKENSLENLKLKHELERDIYRIYLQVIDSLNSNKLNNEIELKYRSFFLYGLNNIGKYVISRLLFMRKDNFSIINKGNCSEYLGLKVFDMKNDLELLKSLEKDSLVLVCPLLSYTEIKIELMALGFQDIRPINYLSCEEK